MDLQKNTFDQIRVDTSREIFVNKICTLAHRCETKDLIDLYFLHRRGCRILDHQSRASGTKEGAAQIQRRRMAG